MNPLAVGIKDYKNGKPEPLWKFKLFKCFQVPVFLAVIDFNDNKVFAH